MATIRQSQMDSMAASSPGTQMVAPCPATKTWIEIHLIDSENNPVPGEKYEVRLPDSSIKKGVLDPEGKVRFDNIVPGPCTVSFPEIDPKQV